MSKERPTREVPGFPLTAEELNAILFDAYGSQCKCRVCTRIRVRIRKLVDRTLGEEEK